MFYIPNAEFYENDNFEEKISNENFEFYEEQIKELLPYLEDISIVWIVPDENEGHLEHKSFKTWEDAKIWINQKKEYKQMKRTKSELIDELKNKISLSLKDSVLQQGFEIICKYDVRRFVDLPDLLLIHGVLLEKIKLQIQVIDRLESCKLKDLQESQLDQTREVLAKVEDLICLYSPCAS